MQTTPSKKTRTTNITTTSTTEQSAQQAELDAIREKNAQLEAERDNYYRQISNLKFCLTILHGQGLEAKKSLKARYSTLVAKKASVKVALAAERSQSAHLDQIANFWQEWINEEEEEEQSPCLRRGQVTSQRQPAIISKPITIYEASDSMTKVNSMDAAD